MAYVDTKKVLETARDGWHSDFGKSMADLTSLREVLEDTPTADVVPRAEVEHWKEEANRYQTLWCKTYNDFEIAEFITEAKAEVASEIFAEIDILVVRRMIPEVAFIDDRLITDIAELQKKYIGDKQRKEDEGK